MIESTSISFEAGPLGTAAFRPGDTLSGTMTLVVSGFEPHKLSSLLVKIRGLAKTIWKTHSSGKHKHTRTHSEELWLIREDIYFIRGPTVEALAPGSYQYPFTYRLRQGLPPTLHSQFGNITYMAKARAISSDLFSFNCKTDHTFDVLSYMDLNADRTLAEPATVERMAERSMFGHEIGMFRLTVGPHQGVVPGELITVEINGPDRLYQKQLKSEGAIKLKRLVLCKAHNAVREVKEDLCTVHPQSEAAWKRATLRVPARESITITEQMCRIISVAHYIKISSRHINQRVPLVVGTVGIGAAPAARAAPAAPASAWPSSMRGTPLRCPHDDGQTHRPPAAPPAPPVQGWRGTPLRCPQGDGQTYHPPSAPAPPPARGWRGTPLRCPEDDGQRPPSAPAPPPAQGWRGTPLRCPEDDGQRPPSAPAPPPAQGWRDTPLRCPQDSGQAHRLPSAPAAPPASAGDAPPPTYSEAMGAYTGNSYWDKEAEARASEGHRSHSPYNGRGSRSHSPYPGGGSRSHSPYPGGGAGSHSASPGGGSHCLSPFGTGGGDFHKLADL